MAVSRIFKVIAEDVGAQAVRVTCSIEEYVDGLETIIDHLSAMKDAAMDDLEKRKD